jgi:hypothetical protein
MKTFFKWTATIGCVSIGGVLIWNAVQSARERMRSAIGRAEAITERTKEALEETESALHAMRTSV